MNAAHTHIYTRQSIYFEFCVIVIASADKSKDNADHIKPVVWTYCYRTPCATIYRTKRRQQQQHGYNSINFDWKISKVAAHISVLCSILYQQLLDDTLIWIPQMGFVLFQSLSASKFIFFTN